MAVLAAVSASGRRLPSFLTSDMSPRRPRTGVSGPAGHAELSSAQLELRSPIGDSVRRSPSARMDGFPGAVGTTSPFSKLTAPVLWERIATGSRLALPSSVRARPRSGKTMCGKSPRRDGSGKPVAVSGMARSGSIVDKYTEPPCAAHALLAASVRQLVHCTIRGAAALPVS